MSLGTPEQGARLLFERRSADENQAEYQLTISETGGTWHAVVTIALPGGSVALDWKSGCPPLWLTEATGAFVRTMHAAWKRADKSVTAPQQIWPRRMHRWRAPRHSGRHLS